MAFVPDPVAAARLRVFTLALLVLNVLATIVAVVVNLPAHSAAWAQTPARSSSRVGRPSPPHFCPWC